MPYKSKEAQRAYQRRWMAQRRRDFFVGKFCIECGIAEMLELDHRDPALKVDHKIWSWSAEKREAEAAKCDIRCHLCHVERHRQLMLTPLVHGTASAYKNSTKKCRCRICKDGNNRREWERRNAARIAA